MQWLTKLFAEDNGNPSSARAAMLFWHGVVAAVWIVFCIRAREMVHLDFIFGVLALVTTGKVVQKFGEQKVSLPPL